MANNFLCDIDDAEAETCLRNIARLVLLQSYLFVSGTDLDVRGGDDPADLEISARLWVLNQPDGEHSLWSIA